MRRALAAVMLLVSFAFASGANTTQISSATPVPLGNATVSATATVSPNITASPSATPNANRTATRTAVPPTPSALPETPTATPVPTPAPHGSNQAPSSLKVEPQSPLQTTVWWSARANLSADGVVVYHVFLDGKLAAGNVPGTNVSLANLNFTTHAVAVSAVVNGAESAQTESVEFLAGIPGPIVKWFSHSDLDECTLNISWVAPNNTGGIGGLTYDFILNGDLVLNRSADASYVIDPILPNFTYAYRAAAYNDIGGGYSAAWASDTFGYFPLAPGNLDVTYTSSSMATVAWTPPSNLPVNISDIFYVVYLDGFEPRVTTGLTMTMPLLRPASAYTVRVAATVNGISGCLSERVTFQTLPVSTQTPVIKSAALSIAPSTTALSALLILLTRFLLQS